MAQDGGIFGRYGYDEMTSTATDGEGSWYAVKAVGGADAVVTIDNAQGDSSTSLTIASGDTIYCTAKEITWVSGKVHAYRNKP